MYIPQKSVAAFLLVKKIQKNPPGAVTIYPVQMTQDKFAETRRRRKPWRATATDDNEVSADSDKSDVQVRTATVPDYIVS